MIRAAFIQYQIFKHTFPFDCLTVSEFYKVDDTVSLGIRKEQKI